MIFSYRTKFLGAFLLFALTTASVVTMNIGLGIYVQYTVKVIGVKCSCAFPHEFLEVFEFLPDLADDCKRAFRARDSYLL